MLTRYVDPVEACHALLFLALNPGMTWIRVDDERLQTKRLHVPLVKVQKLQ